MKNYTPIFNHCGILYMTHKSRSGAIRWAKTNSKDLKLTGNSKIIATNFEEVYIDLKSYINSLQLEVAQLKESDLKKDIKIDTFREVLSLLEVK